MSSIPPPNFLTSIIQTQDAQQRAAAARQRETDADRTRARDTVFADRLQDIIETADGDSRVSPDAEGAGSQGRAFDDAAEDTEQPPPDQSAPPPAGIDIQA